MSKRSERAAPSHTAQRVLDVAERLAQTRGFNGFSYADIAAEMRIAKPSLHYHFATKADLGRALIVRYTHRFDEALALLAGSDAQSTLRKYAHLYESILVRDRMCLCGMFAAEYSTLPASMQSALRQFFDMNEAWLAATLERGRAHGTLRFNGSASEAARTLTAGLEGAMLLARSYEEPQRFAAIASHLLAAFGIVPVSLSEASRNSQRARRSQAAAR